MIDLIAYANEVMTYQVAEGGDNTPAKLRQTMLELSSEMDPEDADIAELFGKIAQAPDWLFYIAIASGEFQAETYRFNPEIEDMLNREIAKL